MWYLYLASNMLSTILKPYPLFISILGLSSHIKMRQQQPWCQFEHTNRRKDNLQSSLWEHTFLPWKDHCSDTQDMSLASLQHSGTEQTDPTHSHICYSHTSQLTTVEEHLLLLSPHQLCEQTGSNGSSCNMQKQARITIGCQIMNQILHIYI